MSHVAHRKIIIAAFDAVWGSTTTVAYDNVSFIPPVGTTAWVRLTIQFMDGDIASLGPIGDRIFRRSGYITADIFTESGTGAKSNDDYCDTILSIYEGKTLDGLVFIQNAHISTIGNYDKWFHQRVFCRFEFDEIR